jgi:ubiquitin-activating enzyme E1
MLKNWAMSGIACSPNGSVHVTDMDVIERGNLNRQFLFRDPDIGSVKSETAAKAAMVMNPDFNINAATNRVGKESENVYNDAFWQGLDLVITALDNVDARLYVDSKCVEHKKPLVDSGTVGTKGSTQVVVPRLTESYASSADPPPTEFPICLLKNFPNKIEHTIQWARDDFEGVFKQTPEDVQKYLTQANFFEKLAEDPVGEHTVITNVHRALGKGYAKNWEDCVRWAVLQFTLYFDHNIRQLLYNFPADHLTKEGTKFWSGPKRAPTPLEFNVKDAEHFNFVQSAASLYAETYGIPVNKDQDALVSIAMDIVIPEWKPKSGVKIAADDDEAKKQATEVDVDEVQKMKASLRAPSEFLGLKMVPLEFEKDDPTNWHVDYVTSCANLRARNYAIKEVTKHEAKRLAGRIIPAIATTTAMVTGLVCLEIMKIIQGKELEAYRNAFCNMALPLFTMSEPKAPESTTAKLKTGDWEWNMWDTLKLELGNCTLQEFLDHFEEELGLDVNMITFGSAMIFAFFTPMKKLKVRKKMRMTELVELITKESLPEGVTSLKLDVNCADPDTDEDVDLPTVILTL